MIKTTLVLLLILAAPVLAQDRVEPPRAALTAEHHAMVTHLAIGAHVVAQFADVSTTSYAMGRGGFHEANPVMRPFAGNPARLAIVKGGYAVATSFFLVRLHKTRPKLALTLAVLSTVTTSYVAHRNARTEGVQ